MVTRKALLQKGDNIILPITRGELVLDSEGKQAFHSAEFVATASDPGLMSPEEKTKVAQAVIVTESVIDKNVRVALLLKEENGSIINIYPTIVSASISDMDVTPTKGNIRNTVSSGGTWQFIDDIVGNIQRVVIQI